MKSWVGQKPMSKYWEKVLQAWIPRKHLLPAMGVIQKREIQSTVQREDEELDFNYVSLCLLEHLVQTSSRQVEMWIWTWEIDQDRINKLWNFLLKVMLQVVSMIISPKTRQLGQNGECLHLWELEKKETLDIITRQLWEQWTNRTKLCWNS